MIFHFETDTVEVDDTDLDVLIIGFYTEDNYLMIQDSFEYDEEDERLHLNTYHIERDDQSMGGYGGVTQIVLQRAHIAVHLDEVGKKHLKCDGVEVDFEADDETYTALVEKLGKIFGDSLRVQ